MRFSSTVPISLAGLALTSLCGATPSPWLFQQKIFQGTNQLAHKLEQAVSGAHDHAHAHDEAGCAARHAQPAETLQSDGSVGVYSDWTGQSVAVEDETTADAVYAGFGSFAHLPMMNCLASDAPFDIGFIGMPLDTATSYRPGARFGPMGIRQGSRRLRLYGGYNVPLDVNPFSSWAKIVDCGDVSATSYDTAKAIQQIEQGHKRALHRTAKATSKSIVSGKGDDFYVKEAEGFGLGGRIHPRIISLGGDHSITLPILRSITSAYGPVSVIHFDSHLDTWKPRVFGGSKSETAAVNHGTYFYHASKEGLIRNGTSIHAGIRTTLSGPQDYENDEECGFKLHEAREIDTIGTQGFIDAIKSTVKDTPVYLSIDIDVLDPSAAPATGTPETGGWSTRELRTILRGLEGVNIVGADLVEVAPAYDTPAEITQIAAADILFEVMSLMVKAGPLTK
ncbi:Arginase/deacetylase [Violaceomyces palustris]|uniref:Arginase/deacetylase n=1 Tax=Violaceomyces palustris TaxID=1673888 RepID=A0ACD0NTJ4_9BASI|nr:Arginase/deacetylase [Violaceomyces palustris]